MTEPLYHSDDAILLIGGAPVSSAQLAAARRYATHVVAADGGALRAKAQGLEPKAIIGDLDSLPDPELWRANGIAVHHIAEQMTTDFEKCISHIKAPLILALGFTGGRMDHTLAVMNSLARHGPGPLVVVGQEDILWALPEKIQLDLPIGTVVSLFPMRKVRGISSTGLRWPVTGIDFAPMGFSGTSNETNAQKVEIWLDRRGMLGMVPLSALDAVLREIDSGNGSRG